MAKIGEILVKITADTRQFDRTMRRTSRAVKKANRRMRTVQGTRRIRGRAMYSAAWLNDPASPRLLHARWQEAWATCYTYMLAVPRALRFYAPGIIRAYFIWCGVAANVLLALLLYGYWLR